MLEECGEQSPDSLVPLSIWVFILDSLFSLVFHFAGFTFIGGQTFN